MEEKWIIVEIGDGCYRRGMPESKWPLAQETARWMIEKAMEAGSSREEAEKVYGVRIVNDDE